MDKELLTRVRAAVDEAGRWASRRTDKKQTDYESIAAAINSELLLHLTALAQHLEAGADIATNALAAAAHPGIQVRADAVGQQAHCTRHRHRLASDAAARLGALLAMVEHARELRDGRVNMQSRRKAAEITNAAHAELRQQYAPLVAELMADGIAYTPATDEVAERLGVSGKTVRRWAPKALISDRSNNSK